MSACGAAPDAIPPRAPIGTAIPNPGTSTPPVAAVPKERLTITLAQSRYQEQPSGWLLELRLSSGPRTEAPISLMFVNTTNTERAQTAQGVVISDQRLSIGSQSAKILMVSIPQDTNVHTVSLLLARPQGFAAGSYDVTILDADGEEMGEPLTVILEGQNPIVDRRPNAF